MQFADIDFIPFLTMLKEMKQELTAEGSVEPESEAAIVMESMDFLTKELKGVKNYEALKFEQKKKILPHIALVQVFTQSLFDMENEEFEDEDFDFDEDDVEFEDLEEAEDEAPTPPKKKK